MDGVGMGRGRVDGRVTLWNFWAFLTEITSSVFIRSL